MNLLFCKEKYKVVLDCMLQEMGIEFYRWCQGEDWERIVDIDTKALLQFMGSDGDEMSRANFREEYEEIVLQTGVEIHIFSEGRHPTILSNAEQAANIISCFLK